MKFKFILFLAFLVFVRCNIPEKICETDEEDNTCQLPDDCVVAYCASDCTKCPAVYSKKQVEEAWCLTPLDGEPRAKCREAGKVSCNQSALPPACPRYVTPDCKDGKCVPVFEPP